MRLTSQQIHNITQVVSGFAGDTAEIYLFGSRLNDQARGGDVDILILMDRRPSRIERGKVKMDLEQVLGLPVDMVIQVRNDEVTPFQAIVHGHATRLEVHA